MCQQWVDDLGWPAAGLREYGDVMDCELADCPFKDGHHGVDARHQPDIGEGDRGLSTPRTQTGLRKSSVTQLHPKC
jgi:hypothetical protein